MISRAAEKPYRGLGMEGSIARWYASLTRKSLGEFQALARRVAGELPPNSEVLEIAPGPGYFAIELAKLGGYQITAVDASRTFVEIARRNAAEAGVTIDFRLGDASSLPFGDGSFDFILCRAAFKNFARPLHALEEFERVLKPAARALILDLRGDASNEAIGQAVEEMHVGAVNGLITKLTFRFMLLKRAFTRAQMEQFAAQTKFASVEIRQNLIGMEVMLRHAG